MSFMPYVPPEQIMKDRSDYAQKGIARGKSVVGIEFASGLLFIAENPSTTLHKISEIYDRIAFAGVGKYSEFEDLRIAVAEATSVLMEGGGVRVGSEALTQLAVAEHLGEFRQDLQVLLGRRFRHQHGRLHVRGGTQAESVAIAVLPDDLVGERLGGDEQGLPLLGEVGDGEAHVRREGADQEGGTLAAQQLLGDTHRVARYAVVVTTHDLDLAAEHAARSIHFLDHRGRDLGHGRSVRATRAGERRQRRDLDVAIEELRATHALMQGGEASSAVTAAVA